MPDRKPGAPEQPADKALEERVETIMNPKQLIGTESPIPTVDVAATSAATKDPKVADQLDDSATDKAIDDIMVNESDTVLAAEDAAKSRSQKSKASGGLKPKLRSLVRNKWTWLGVIVVLVIVFGVPVTRYKVLGLAIKKSVTITVRDSKSDTPVSGAEIRLATATAKTDANGRAHLKAGVGNQKMEIKKQYYQTATSHYFVGFKSAGAQPVKLVATGRLVPLTITNKITGKPLKGVEIKVLDTTAKTDTNGQATVALPTNAPKDSAKLNLAGYNTAAVSIEVTDSIVKANSFTLTPAGHIYFLSNLNGTIDVVKAELDGGNRKVILAGTGKEDQNTTSLLAARDWHYLVLKARRDSAQPALYLLDTSDDKVTQFDNGDADFNLVGWSGHYFMYSLTRSSLAIWQAGKQVLKSYDADNLQLNQLDQNQAEGSSTSNYSQQNLANYYIIDGAVTYTTQWNVYAGPYGTPDFGSKTNTIRAVQPNGQGKKDYQSFPASGFGSIQATPYEPQSIYYALYSTSDTKVAYYSFEDQAVKPVTLDAASFNKPYPTFLLSPSGNQTFWTELRDGKNSLFVGDTKAQNKKQLANLSNYSPYGWYSDAYTLVSKDSSELYIMPSNGLDSSQQPLKITDYYKPAQSFNGYGGGYGGL